MDAPVLSVRNLSKHYAKRSTDILRPDNTIVALDGVSFELHKGEVLGIIGHNGAGKTTLLKILSEVSAPTSGEIEYTGKLTSILEVGTGFHPDLSGKENVFLSASFQGLSKKEITLIYDDIVAFSGLEEYMEMPVKNFSSGMYLRLAFSVAFHAPIDILLVDEVLAVGDADFRKKCYDRIRKFAAQGASIILVSHNTNQIIEFCQRCLLFKQGKLIKEGVPLEVIEFYLESDSPLSTTQPSENRIVGPIEVLSVEVRGENHPDAIVVGDSMDIVVQLKKQVDNSSIEIFLFLTDVNGQRVMMDAYALREDYVPKKYDKGLFQVKCRIPRNLLSRGVFTVGLVFSINLEHQGELSEVTRFKVEVPSDSVNKEFYNSISCSIMPRLSWTIEQLKSTADG